MGLFLGWLIFHPTKAERAAETQIEGHEGHDHSSEDPTTWTCSMHPQIKQDSQDSAPSAPWTWFLLLQHNQVETILIRMRLY